MKLFLSYIIALIRLCFLVVLFLLEGIHNILFNRLEVANIVMQAIPLRADVEEAVEKIALVDKLCIQNPELAYPKDTEISDKEEDLGDEGGQYEDD